MLRRANSKFVSVQLVHVQEEFLNFELDFHTEPVKVGSVVVWSKEDMMEEYEYQQLMRQQQQIQQSIAALSSNASQAPQQIGNNIASMAMVVSPQQTSLMQQQEQQEQHRLVLMNPNDLVVNVTGTASSMMAPTTTAPNTLNLNDDSIVLDNTDDGEDDDTATIDLINWKTMYMELQTEHEKLEEKYNFFKKRSEQLEQIVSRGIQSLNDWSNEYKRLNNEEYQPEEPFGFTLSGKFYPISQSEHRTLMKGMQPVVLFHIIINHVGKDLLPELMTSGYVLPGTKRKTETREKLSEETIHILTEETKEFVTFFKGKDKRKMRKWLGEALSELNLERTGQDKRRVKKIRLDNAKGASSASSSSSSTSNQTGASEKARESTRQETQSS